MCFREQKNNSSQFTADGDVESVCAGHVFMGQRESVCVQDMFSLGRAANYVVEAQHMLLSNSQFTGKFKGEKTCFPIFNVC